MKTSILTSRIKAAMAADWGQVVSNGGPPCFHIDKGESKFCLRAERWAGHPIHHPFLSLADMLREGTTK